MSPVIISRYVALLWAFAVAMAVGQAAAEAKCNVPLTTHVIEDDAMFVLPSEKYGSNVVAAGAYVMALYKATNGTYYSKFSFNHGSTFTSRRYPVTAANVAQMTEVNLVSDGRDVIAMGKMDGKIMSNYFDFGDLSWTNATVFYSGDLSGNTYVACDYKQNLFVCAIGGTNVNEGITIKSLQSESETAAVFNRQWMKLNAGDMPVVSTPPGIASDGEGFMVCNVGDLMSNTGFFCSFSFNGTADYVEVAPATTQSLTTSNIPVKIASNKIRGHFIVAYLYNNVVNTAITFDAGASWEAGKHLFPGSTTLPKALVVTNKFLAMYQVGNTAFASFQNNTTPLDFEEQWELVTGTNVGLASGNFGDNYMVIYHGVTGNQINVSSCIPTAAPTIMPSPSPTSNNAMGPNGSGVILSLVAMLLAFVAI